MKQAILSLAAIFLVNLTPCTTFAVEQERSSAAPTAAQERQQYEKSMEDRLGRLGRQFDELKDKAAGKTDQARDEMKRLLTEAEEKQEAASRKLEEMRQASKKKWRKFSSDMSNAADEFEQAFERAKSRFKE